MILIFIVLPKRVSSQIKQDFVNSFVNGLTIEEISAIYKFSSQTIIKNLKIALGDDQYRKTKIDNKKNNLNTDVSIDKRSDLQDYSAKNKTNFDDYKEDIFEEINNDSFVEIIPISNESDFKEQKDFSTKPISKYNFPSVVYMIINKTIELETKTLNDYPEWRFLSEKDLERETLEIFSDQKKAKKACSKNQKLIKVPNPNVFIIASKNLKSKGISRIIHEDTLLSL